ncbi:MAG: hypothetical protein ACP6IS_00515 [Candidatus Asgardarchaeia archaeon]
MSLAERVLTRPKTTDPLIAKVVLPYAIMIFTFKFMMIVALHVPYIPVIPQRITLAFQWVIIPPQIELFGVYLFVPDGYFLIPSIFDFVTQFLNAYIAGYLIALIVREHKPKDRFFELPHLVADDSYFDLLKFFILWYFLYIALVIYPSYYDVPHLVSFLLQGMYWLIGIFLIFTPYLIVLKGKKFISSLKESYKISTEKPGILLKSVIGSALLFSIFESIMSLTNNFFLHFFAALFVGFPILITLSNFIIRELIKLEGVEVYEKND